MISGIAKIAQLPELKIAFSTCGQSNFSTKKTGAFIFKISGDLNLLLLLFPLFSTSTDLYSRFYPF